MANNKKPFCITFAGVVGSSKTPIAHYLSTKLNLPVFDHDYIRIELREDLLEYITGNYVKEYKKRKNERLQDIFNKKLSFIYDTSMDRRWEEAKKNIEEYGYKWFLISLDLSKELLAKLYRIKDYKQSLKRIDNLLADHNDFLSKHADDISLHITDENFLQRLEISETAVSNWLLSL